MKKKPRVIWTFEPPPVPDKNGVAKYYWYASGSDNRIDMVCIGRGADDGEPFSFGMFHFFDEQQLKDADGAWFGPIEPPYVGYRNRSIDYGRKKKLERASSTEPA